MDTPLSFTTADIPHVGTVCTRIRSGRGLSKTDLATELGVSPSSIARIEQNGSSRRHNLFARYVAALQAGQVNGKPLLAPLNPRQGNLLLELYEASNGHRRARAVKLAALSFEDIRSSRRPKPLEELLARLRAAQNPAFISDVLWFTHACNGRMLNLFDAGPDHPFFHRWEGWHVFGGKFTDESPVRDAHVNPDIYFPPTVDFFFQSTAPCLFTLQMRALLAELHRMSDRNGLHFAHWWHSATSFSLHYDLSLLSRLVCHRGRTLTFQASMPEFVNVELACGHRATYMYAEFLPATPESAQGFAELTAPAPPHEVYFAADFDRAGCFHVNSWPAVHAELAQWVKEGVC